MEALGPDPEEENVAIARRWCQAQQPPWTLENQAGRGGTAPVFVVAAPDGRYALKLYDAAFSSGAKGEIEKKRIEQQVEMGEHGCPHLINVYAGGTFEARLYLVMNLAAGSELEKVLGRVPRDKIRGIVDKVATACQFLREKGLSHRDIKAANIFVSDDYDTVTLLDLSVMRDIHDPVGIGTDHGDQLPVVATARYSPPEYLFRLEDPSPAFWHGVDVYQLGGLLHDLIMRVPLFEQEFQMGRENRYRFAWAVATKTPHVSAQDVDQDLIGLARRALSKDWAGRREIELSEFQASREARRDAALAILGLGGRVPASATAAAGPASLRAVARELEADLSNRLLQLGATAVHESAGGVDWSAADVTFEWTTASDDLGLTASSTKLRVRLQHGSRFAQAEIESRVELTISLEGASRAASLALPAVAFQEGAATLLAENVSAVLGELGARALAAE